MIWRKWKDYYRIGEKLSSHICAPNIFFKLLQFNNQKVMHHMTLWWPHKNQLPGNIGTILVCVIFVQWRNCLTTHCLATQIPVVKQDDCKVRAWLDIALKKICKWTTSTWKDPQIICVWEIKIHGYSEVPLKRGSGIASVPEGTEIGGNIKWFAMWKTVLCS